MLAGQFSACSGVASEAKITTVLIISCVIAAMGGFINGYCFEVVTGPCGILLMDSFLNKFYPVEAYRKMKHLSPYPSINYCMYDDFKEGKPFIYSLFLAALTATFLASYTTRRLGRRHTMSIAGVFFIVGIILSTAAQDLAMLFIGRIFLGCGFGFAYQVAPIYISEIAPTEIRGALNILFQLSVSFGILLAHIVNYGTTNLQDVDFYATIMIDVVVIISTIVSMLYVDKIGRRKLLLEAGLHMFLSLFLIAIILGIKVKDHSSNISHGLATFVVILICTFLSSYSWSWGALGWLIPSEAFPLESRSIGQSVTFCVYILSTCMSANTFLPMLCIFKFGIFMFFSGWVLVMSFFVLFFIPETKNIPIEDMKERVWKRHWFWKRFVDD